MSEARDHVLRLAEDAHRRGDATGWLERVYADAAGDPARVPWAHLEPNRNLVEWLDRRGVPAGRALVVGCGLGDDAEELARRGHDVTAFDVAASAVAWCHERHPASPVHYVVADLLHPPAEWAQAFDLVVEVYTLQVLLGEDRRRALLALPGFVAPGGTLLLIARLRDEEDPEGALPWPLTRRDLSPLAELDLTTVGVEDYVDAEGVRRLRAEFTRPTG